MSHYALIRPSEDGDPIRLIGAEKLQMILEHPDEWGIERFETEAFLGANPDTNYWKDGIAVLMKVEVIVPRPVTATWTID